MPRVVALVPAKDRADSVGATVAALRGLEQVERVVVVDDGSTDDTTEAARRAGATVVRLPVNEGKGGAVAAGVAATPDAHVYLLVDADVGTTGAAVDALLTPVLDGDLDLAIGVLPPAEGRGGFGKIRDLARAGIRRACGFEASAPLSGQRAIRADLLRGLVLAPRFGLEVALTIDAVRAGARVGEVPVAMDHRHTGRSVAGFRHRAGQGLDVVRALWPRLTSGRQRLTIIGVVLLLAVAAVVWSGSRWEPSSVALVAERPAKVVLFGLPHLEFDDLGSGDAPNLDAMVAEGAVAATSVRTLSGRPSSTEGYASLGAGTRVRAGDAGALAFASDQALEGSTARDAAALRTGRTPTGEIVVVGGPSTIRLISGEHLSSEPGALGEALHDAGLRTGVVGNADNAGAVDDDVDVRVRPAAVALMDGASSVDLGRVDADLLTDDPSVPFGHRADPAKMIAEIRRVLAGADVVLIDPGDLDRAVAFRPLALDRAADEHRRAALRRTDALLGEVRSLLSDDTLLLVVSVSPPASGWHLTPMLATGPGLRPGYLHSPSTKRLGVVTVTDVAPTVLDVLGAPVPDGMIGHALRSHPGRADLQYLEHLDRDANARESVYFPLTVAYIVVQALLYLTVMLAFSKRGGVGRAGPVLRWVVLAVAAYPLATFLLRAIPGSGALGEGMVPLVLAITAAVATLALRARRHPLSPLAWILGATVALLLIDVSTGARLQTSSLLGYSLHTAARFFGIGNTAFATLAACSVLVACIHVQYAPRRQEAMAAVGALLALVVLVDGAPMLGNDVGGVLTLVPVFGLTLWVLSGRRISWRSIAVAAIAAVVVLALVTAVDLTRAAEDRTHIGRFFSGEGDAADTVLRKLATNIRVFGATVWTWMVPIIAALMIYLLAWDGRGTRILPAGSALRAGVVGALAAGLLGFAVNDSGVVVTALVFVYIGPYLTLMAMHHEHGEPVVLSPLPVAEASSAPVPTPAS